MENIASTPAGETEVYTPQHDGALPNETQNTGWRRPTANLAMAERFASDGESLSIPKTRAFAAVKRVGAHIGLKAADMLLLDTLGAFTQQQDWDQGQRPIVWPSNAYLSEQTGLSISALKRHARRLANLGIISFKDSANGKRWGRRGRDGRILEAYGFDLSPLAARAEEFEALHAQVQIERETCKRLKRQITVSRRIIRAQIEAITNQTLESLCDGFIAKFEALLSQLPKRRTTSETLEALLAGFKSLQHQLEQTYLKLNKVDQRIYLEANVDVLEEPQEMGPKGAETEPHTQTTNELKLVKSCLPNSAANQAHKHTSPLKNEVNNHASKIGISTILNVCPEFTQWSHNLGTTIKNWTNLHTAAAQLAPMIGISVNAWNQAQGRLGRTTAAAAVALIFDKHSTGEIRSPSGYLQGMLNKAASGKLHLDQSYHAKLQKLQRAP